jgi:hypothetical protein
MPQCNCLISEMLTTARKARQGILFLMGTGHDAHYKVGSQLARVNYHIEILETLLKNIGKEFECK